MSPFLTRRPVAWLTPFFVAAALLLYLLILGNTRFGPSNNVFFVFAALSIVIGLALGVVGLFRAHTVPWSVRILAGLLYVPAALASALLAGF